MEADAGHKDRPPVSVVPWMIHILEIERRTDASPKVQSIIKFRDVFSPVVEPSVSQ